MVLSCEACRHGAGRSKAAPAGETFMKADPKTLIVDDSSIFLEMMTYMLHECGILEITKAENGSQALELFQAELQAETPYALVFLDIVMPGMDGQETLKQLRALEKAAGITVNNCATIIMATSLHSTKEMVTALIEGKCSDYIVKPIVYKDLRRMLVDYDYVSD
jgi:two-component system chemotaxis response regulator CheY